MQRAEQPPQNVDLAPNDAGQIGRPADSASEPACQSLAANQSRPFPGGGPRYIQDPVQRKKAGKSAFNSMRAEFNKLEKTSHAEGIIIVMVPGADGQMDSGLIRSHTTPGLTALDGYKLLDVALCAIDLHYKAQDFRAHMTDSEPEVPLHSLTLEAQRGLMKWVIRLLMKDQKANVPFKSTTAEEVHAKYSWYPESVAWQSPLQWSAEEIEAVFECAVPILRPSRLQTIQAFTRSGFKGPIAETQTALRVLKSALSQPNEAQQRSAPERSTPYVIIDGRKLLGDKASSSQILELTNERRQGNKLRSSYASLCRRKLPIENVYNAVQQQGGWDQVSNDVEKQREVLTRLEFDGSLSEQTALKKFWEHWLAPLCNSVSGTSNTCQDRSNARQVEAPAADQPGAESIPQDHRSGPGHGATRGESFDEPATNAERLDIGVMQQQGQPGGHVQSAASIPNWGTCAPASEETCIQDINKYRQTAGLIATSQLTQRIPGGRKQIYLPLLYNKVMQIGGGSFFQIREDEGKLDDLLDDLRCNNLRSTTAMETLEKLSQLWELYLEGLCPLSHAICSDQDIEEDVAEEGPSHSLPATNLLTVHETDGRPGRPQRQRAHWNYNELNSGLACANRTHVDMNSIYMEITSVLGERYSIALTTLQAELPSEYRAMNIGKLRKICEELSNERAQMHPDDQVWFFDKETDKLYPF